MSTESEWADGPRYKPGGPITPAAEELNGNLRRLLGEEQEAEAMLNEARERYDTSQHRLDKIRSAIDTETKKRSERIRIQGRDLARNRDDGAA